MYCSNCDGESPAGSQQCGHCQAPLTPSDPPSPRPRTSTMAVVSLGLGILGLVTLGITALLGLVLGVVSLRKINRSGGRLRGSGLAIAGICVSAYVVVMIPLMAAWFSGMFVRGGRASAKKAVCLSNVKNISLALSMYTADFDDRFPRADIWCDVLSEYVKNEDVYQCPSEKELICGYAYSVALDEAALADAGDPMEEVAFFESDAGWNAAGEWELLTPEPRHLGGDCWGYVDGHAAWEPRYEEY